MKLKLKLHTSIFPRQNHILKFYLIQFETFQIYHFQVIGQNVKFFLKSQSDGLIVVISSLLLRVYGQHKIEIFL